MATATSLMPNRNWVSFATFAKTNGLYMNITVTLNLLGISTLNVQQSDMALNVAEKTTIADLLVLIEQRNPGFTQAVTAEDGSISRQFVLFVNGRNIYHMDGMNTELSPDDVVNMIPAIAGG